MLRGGSAGSPPPFGDRLKPETYGEVPEMTPQGATFCRYAVFPFVSLQLWGFVNTSNLARIERDTDRDHFMTAEEAKAYGLIDTVISKRG